MTEPRPDVDPATSTADEPPPLYEWSEDHSPDGRCDFCERMNVLIDHDGEDPIDAIRRYQAEVARLRADLTKVREIAASRENDVMESLDENERLRDDLAAARRVIREVIVLAETGVDWGGNVSTTALLAALSAGGTDRTGDAVAGHPAGREAT